MYDLKDRTGKFAIITGASSGIGHELAAEFARHGFDLLIAGKSPRIFSTQDDLEQFGTLVDAIQVDLSSANGVQDFYDYILTHERRIDLVVLNAGVGISGDFSQTDFRDEVKLINLNIFSSVHLSKLMLKKFYEQGSGHFLFTSSISEATPSSFEAVQSASKAFVSSFANAIRYEAQDRDVKVTTLMAGFDETSTDDLARLAYQAVMDGKDQVFAASLKSKFQGWATKFIHRKNTEADFLST